jgi:pimeloyl-ACP methyl ester carboxylesterase
MRQPEGGSVTDLFVIAHGWNNHMDEARSLYRDFFGHVRAEQDAGRVPGAAGRGYAVLGVLWPSKKFADKELIASGAAGASSAVTDTVLLEQLDDLKGVFSDPRADDKLEQAKRLVGDLEDKRSARRQFADLLRSMLPADAADDEDASTSLFELRGDQVMERLSKPVLPARPASRGTGGSAARIGDPASPAGGAAGIGRFFSGIKSAARNLMNFATYYQMKERAGTVGRQGLSPLLHDIRARRPDLKLHLIGHSFGGRLVTAAAAGRDDRPVVKPDTLVLLQAAFSHHGFARRFDGTRDGFFRRVVENQLVAGPVVITCTRNDRAVGLAYPLASLIAGQVAAELGDKNDLYGGIGRNGAQKTPEAVDGTLLAAGGAYAFQAGSLYNLKADQFISDHSDICGDEVAHALLTAVAAT